jgi:predicted enzyme related to lactoylglutathione lyase
MAKGIRKAGAFCWFNMLTPQPAEAREFFGRLLGWTFVEIPGMGQRIQVGGREIGGLFDLDGPSSSPRTPPHIGCLLKVNSADEICAKVSSHGGIAEPAFDIADQGRIAACTDPDGARFVIWQPSKFVGTDVESRSPGAASWFEIVTTDVSRAAKFYSEVFGWTPEVKTMPGLEYTNFKLGDEYVAGMLQITPVMGPTKPHWGTYFTVSDAAETERKAIKLGGEISVPVREIPRVGRFCGITSPQGVMFYAIEYTD